jgi:hypothetical protein
VNPLKFPAFRDWQAVVDKSAPVASAVLVSAMHMLGDNAEVVKRWTSEIQEVVQSKHGMVQFHAVSLLHALRAKDRLAVSKLVSTLVKGNIRSPLAQCMLVRYVARVRSYISPPPPTHHSTPQILRWTGLAASGAGYASRGLC